MALPRPFFCLRQLYRTQRASVTWCRLQHTDRSIRIIDLRSDAISKPPQEMREAMMNAEVGDDVFGDDPTVNKLKARVAKMLGKEAALFVPSGTMGNLISIMTHCQGRGLEAIVGDQSHIFLHEQGGMAHIAGVMGSVIKNKPDGTFDITEMKSLIRRRDDIHEPWTRMICLENTHNKCGGRVLPQSFMQEVYEIATENDIIVHLDGSRILNAAVALDIPPSEISQYCHSVQICFSKGLSCPIGSIIAGTNDFIFMAERMRKAVGGAMRQVGILAGAVLYALDNIAPKLIDDHRHARRIAESMLTDKNKIVKIDLDAVDTNIVFGEIIEEGLLAEQFCRRMSDVIGKERVDLGIGISVKMFPYSKKSFRFVLHNNISEEEATLACKKFRYVVEELSDWYSSHQSFREEVSYQ
ncbi:hypothetical protein ScPMuIL_003593 [Solemya velum]